ncbi:MAG: ribosomal protein small subunit ribosomal protein [Candidatus Berkelbacteria bacterium]|nr:ribosomal protein small subunit ribosomal protein [Candidatus Berkelbacteria bacterium]
MIVIRLRRTGKKGQPSYRIVVADNRAPIYGKYIEMLGHYNPDTKKIVLESEKAIEWMKKGAKPTNTVSKIFIKQGLKHNSILIKKYRAVSKKELEGQKAQEEKEKSEEAAKKEAAKEAFDQQVEAEKDAAPKEDILSQMAEESIQETKEGEVKIVEAKKPAEDIEVKTKAKEEKPKENKKE